MATPTTSEQTTSVGLSSVTYINALVGGEKWGDGVGTAITLTYSFPSSGSVWSTASAAFGGYGAANSGSEPWSSSYSTLNVAQQNAFVIALQSWADVANVSFVQVADNSSVVGDIRVAFSATDNANSSAHAYYPYSPGPIGGDIWLNPYVYSNLDPRSGNFGLFTLVHELGHALGLKHTFEDGVTLPQATDSNQYSVMSYTDPPTATIYPSGPMLYDIAAIQYLYGKNTNTRAGNDTYQFSSASEEYRAIWDAGGVDTFDASNQVLAASINLNAGAFSSIGVKNNGAAAQSNISIAYDATIENAKGGFGSDAIVGNAEDNTLTGNNGNDTLTGGNGRELLYGGSNEDVLLGNRGDDTLYGGAGLDALYGGLDNDMLVGGDDNDTAYGNDGTDQVFGNQGADVLLGNAGNDTIFGGAGNDMLFGGRDDDTLYGDAGNDTLYGDPGNDLLYGGDGADTFVFGPVGGTDTVADFNYAAGDSLQLSPGIAFTMTDESGGAVLHLSSGTNVVLSGYTKSQVASGWIVYS